MSSQDEQVVRETAYAKVNLILEVMGRRDDGYHEIRSVLQTIDLADHLIFELADGVHLSCSSPDLEGESNLVIRAARVVQDATGHNQGTVIQLNKHIPAAMGLGGGSSDAAATLRALNRLWDLGLSVGELRGLAAEVGSDVPFFISGGTALVSGRGEAVYPLPPAPTSWLVLLAPPIWMANKTARMYSLLDEECYTNGEATQELLKALEEGHLASDLLFNCFGRVMQTAFTGIESFVAALLDVGAPKVHLAGAGPTLFALASDRAQAEEMAQKLIASGHRVFVQKTMGAVSP